MSEPSPSEPDEITPDDVTDETDAPEADDWTPPDRESWDKLQAKAQRREAKLREAQAELAKLRDKPEDQEPSEADKLRQGMVRTAGRAVLAGVGITDKKDQSALLDAIKLDGIEVDEDGEVDTDELEGRLAELRRILAPAASSRTPVRPRVSTRDQGGRNSDPADPDAARYARIMGQR